MINSILRILLLGLVFPASSLAESLSIRLHDNAAAVGSLSVAGDGSNAALLLHQCNRDQRMWAPLVETLNERGISTMTVDLRGYGESATRAYSVQEHGFDTVVANIGQDIISINKAWREATAGANQRIVIGASCGGGLATRLAVESEDIDALVLFSPSLRSRWLPESVRDSIDKTRDLPLLAVVAEGDTAAVESIGLAFDRNESPVSQRVTYKGELHGQPLYEHDPLLATLMAEWVVRAIAATP